MSFITQSLEILEGESNRFLWLPAVTWGYLSTISGRGIEFAFMILSIVGARLIIDAVNIWNESEEKRAAFRFEEKQEKFIKAVFLVYLVLFYAAPVRLWSILTFDNPIIIGLSGIWAGLLLILVMDYYLELESALVEVDPEPIDSENDGE